VHYESPYIYQYAYNLLSIEISQNTTDNTTTDNTTTTENNAILGYQKLRKEYEVSRVTFGGIDNLSLKVMHFIEHIDIILNTVLESSVFIDLDVQELRSESDTLRVTDFKRQYNVLRISIEIGTTSTWIIFNDRAIPKVSFFLLRHIIHILCFNDIFTGSRTRLDSENVVQTYNNLIQDICPYKTEFVPLKPGYSNHGIEFPIIRGEILNAIDENRNEYNNTCLSCLTISALQDAGFDIKSCDEDIAHDRLVFTKKTTVLQKKYDRLRDEEDFVYTKDGALGASVLYQHKDMLRPGKFLRSGMKLTKKQLQLCESQNFPLDRLFWERVVEPKNKGMFQRITQRHYPYEVDIYWRILDEIEWNIVQKIPRKSITPLTTPKISIEERGINYIQMDLNVTSWNSWHICFTTSQVKMRINNTTIQPTYMGQMTCFNAELIGGQNNIEILIYSVKEKSCEWFLWRENDIFPEMIRNIQMFKDDNKNKMWAKNGGEIYTCDI
jgi:hypothetical protein